MKMFKLSFFCCLLSSLFLFSCDKEITGKTYAGTITLSASQVVPPTASSATGTMTATYDQKTKFLSYTVKWSGLSGPDTAMHIHGFADPGFNSSLIIQTIIGAGGVDVANATKYPASGSISAKLFIDGVLVREADLLSGKLYIDIHTSAYKTGEIRGQILLLEQ
jgi:hypothetical protein